MISSVAIIPCPAVAVKVLGTVIGVAAVVSVEIVKLLIDMANKSSIGAEC
jgi:hypothetical protein